MPDYLVEWDIDIFDVSTPHDAAEKALRIQRNPNSIATVFRVTNTETSEQTIIDLGKQPEAPNRYEDDRAEDDDRVEALWTAWEIIDGGNR
jgi:hypothetical protein